MPPLRRAASVDPASCRPFDKAECWSLAPWRGRTIGADAPKGADPAGAPRWVFAPPVVPGLTVSPTPRTPVLGQVPAQVGCWSFSPSALCARSEENS
ncbi:hypothetical protein Misp01_62610 [Microtetraspora sp. NBRC 13810]|nr:hypothetical protein Misp01_62610 [Microtetraspora sp. NBRC 13810]